MANVLIVEDELSTRMVLEIALVDAGHLVHGISSAEEALEMGDGLRCFDVMLTDVRMPDRSDHDLARMVIRECPNLRVILISGLDDDCAQCPYQPRCVFLHKPFSIAELLYAIRYALAAPRPAARGASETPQV